MAESESESDGRQEEIPKERKRKCRNTPRMHLQSRNRNQQYSKRCQTQKASTSRKTPKKAKLDKSKSKAAHRPEVVQTSVQSDSQEDPPLLKLRNGKVVTVNETNFKIEKELGKGTYGVVYRAISMGLKSKVALKFMHKDWELDDPKPGEPHEESEVFKMRKLANYMKENKLDLANNFLVKMFSNHMYKDTYKCLIYELLGQSLFDYMYNGPVKGSKRFFSVEDTKLIVYQIVVALEFLKRHQIVHTDIKPENVVFLIPREDSYECDVRIKLIDFGCASFGDEPQKWTCGTQFYQAPEVLLGHWHYPCDMWSLGALTYELFTGNTLFDLKQDNFKLKVDNRAFKNFKGNDCSDEQKMNDICETQHLAMIEKLIEPIQKESNYSNDRYNKFRTNIEKKYFLKKLPAILEQIYSKRELVFDDGGKEDIRRLFDFVKQCLVIKPNDRLDPEGALTDAFLVDVDKQRLDNIKQFNVKDLSKSSTKLPANDQVGIQLPPTHQFAPSTSSANQRVPPTVESNQSININTNEETRPFTRNHHFANVAQNVDFKLLEQLLAESAHLNIETEQLKYLFELYFLQISKQTIVSRDPVMREAHKHKQNFPARPVLLERAQQLWEQPLDAEHQAEVQYRIGDIVMAKVGLYPYWPAVIQMDPVDGSETQFQFTTTDEENGIRSYYLQFIGPLLCRSWTPTNKVKGMYTGWQNYKNSLLREFLQICTSDERDKAKKMGMFCRFRDTHIPKSTDESLIYGNNLIQEWVESLNEAEGALLMTNVERIEALTYEYVDQYTPEEVSARMFSPTLSLIQQKFSQFRNKASSRDQINVFPVAVVVN